MSPSKRQQQVWSLIARGLTNKEIARELGISPATVKNHAREFYWKLNVSGRVRAALCFGRVG